MLKSKRFVITLVVFVSYLAGVYFYKVEPLNFALGLSALLTPYIFGQSYRKSKIPKEQENNNV